MKAHIKISGRTFTAEGKTVEEAIGNLDIGIGRMRGNAVMTVVNGNKTLEKIIPAFLITRLFSPNPNVRNVNLKQVAMRLGA